MSKYRKWTIYEGTEYLSVAPVGASIINNGCKLHLAVDIAALDKALELLKNFHAYTDNSNPPVESIRSRAMDFIAEIEGE